MKQIAYFHFKNKTGTTLANSSVFELSISGPLYTLIKYITEDPKEILFMWLTAMGYIPHWKLKLRN